MGGHRVDDRLALPAPGAVTQVDLIRYLGVAVGPANPVDTDVVNRAARLLGVVYGNQAALQQVAGTLELITQDTGLNTNPERWLHDNHWDSGVEIVLVAAAAVNLGAAVGAGVTRRIREITVRNAAQANTVITLSDAGGDRLSFDVPAQSTRTWSSQDGREFAAASQPQIASSAAAAAPAQTFITATGVESA